MNKNPIMLMRMACSMSTAKIAQSLNKNPIQKFETDIVNNNSVPGLSIDAAAWLIPHPEKAGYGGEDSYFIAEKGTVLGVFDGVGGWISAGVNPRDYSYALMRNCLAAANACLHGTSPLPLTSPLQVLTQGFDETQRARVVGTCTASIVAINHRDNALYLDGLNVGDSGFMLVKSVNTSEKRELKISLRTKEQQHGFNMPYQLGADSSDHPSQGDRYTAQLEKGDILVMGTDGLWDNTYDDEILQIVGDNYDASPQQIAQKIAQTTFAFSADETRFSPFAKNAQRYYRNPQAFNGGKEDDITVLVLKIGSNHSSAKL